MFFPLSRTSGFFKPGNPKGRPQIRVRMSSRTLPPGVTRETLWAHDTAPAKMPSCMASCRAVSSASSYNKPKAKGVAPIRVVQRGKIGKSPPQKKPTKGEVRRRKTLQLRTINGVPVETCSPNFIHGVGIWNNSLRTSKEADRLAALADGCLSV